MKRLPYFFVMFSILFCFSCATVEKRPAKPVKARTPVFKNDLEKALYWFQSNPELVKEALSRNHVVYYKAGSPHGNYSREFGDEKSIHFPFTHFPVWSADRKSLYLSLNDRKTGEDNIIRLSKNGKVEHVFNYKGNIWYYDVSPDEKQLVINIKEDEKYQVWIVNLKDGSLSMFSDPETGGVFPKFSPDGESIAYVASRKIRDRDIETGKESIIVNDNMMVELPDWSPDGKWIVYQAAESTGSYDIYKVNLKNGLRTQLTRNPGLDANPCFNKKGDEIIFIRSDNINQGDQILALMDADGHNVRIDTASEKNIYFPTW